MSVLITGLKSKQLPSFGSNRHMPSGPWVLAVTAGRVTNGCGNGVTWSVKESGGGTVTPTGLYTAPATPGTFHVAVTSTADPTKRSTATVTVTTGGANKITVTPQAAVVQPGSTLRLQTNSAVNWTVAEGVSGGSISSNGTYTAATKPGLFHVVASSPADTTNRTIVNIAVVGGKLKLAYVANLDKNSVSVLTSVKGSGPGTVQLHEMQSVSAGQAPGALSLSPDGKYLLSANQGSDDVSLFGVSQTDGTLGVVHGPSIDTGSRPSSVAFDSTGRMAFVTNHDSDDISVFSVNAASGQMVLLGKQALTAGDKPSAVAVHLGGNLVFVSSAGSDTVQGFSYDAVGMLKPISGSPFATGSGPASVTIDPAGKFLFVANRGSDDVSVFAIDAKAETLQEVSGSPFPAGKGTAAISTDITGTYVFVTGHDSNEVVTFQMDGATGDLTRLGSTPLTAAGPSSLAVDPSGQYLYLTSDTARMMTTWKLDVSTGKQSSLSRRLLRKGSCLLQPPAQRNHRYQGPASSWIARRRLANDLGDEPMRSYHGGNQGYCSLDSQNRLTGLCIGNGGQMCVLKSDPTHCPIGKQAISPTNYSCQIKQVARVDASRICTD